MQFGREGFAGIAARWNALDAYAGQPVRILPGTGGVGEGEALFEGLAEGVDAGGALRLRTAQGMRSIVAGEGACWPAARPARWRVFWTCPSPGTTIWSSPGCA
ncbi:MAG: hypothetical protein MO853_00575 [Candidatus Protistobacter heckmanni]|nr:hypothetical protein [Candidatus Protistobacter heckmanni]